MDYLFYYIYRVRRGHAVDWDEPTGGMFIPAEDLPYLRRVGKQRYHCAPNERLIFLQVTDAADRWCAWLYHQAWEREMREFEDLMTVDI